MSYEISVSSTTRSTSFSLFTIKIIELLSKIKSVDAWIMKLDHGGLIIEYSVSSMNIQKLEPKKIYAKAIMYNPDDESWYVIDMQGNYYKLAWTNVNKESTSGYYKSKEDVDNIVKLCKNIMVYTL